MPCETSHCGGLYMSISCRNPSVRMERDIQKFCLQWGVQRKGQSGAWLPRQPQWQHCGELSKSAGQPEMVASLRLMDDVESWHLESVAWAATMGVVKAIEHIAKLVKTRMWCWTFGRGGVGFYPFQYPEIATSSESEFQADSRRTGLRSDRKSDLVWFAVRFGRCGNRYKQSLLCAPCVNQGILLKNLHLAIPDWDLALIHHSDQHAKSGPNSVP
jgi:hypothetical protein